jgi:hypothetical protein
MELASNTKPNWVSDSSLAVLISGILGTHARETTPITKNCNHGALRALVARSLVTGARLVEETGGKYGAYFRFTGIVTVLSPEH